MLLGLHVFVTPISKHVASQYRWQGRDFNRRLETCGEEETCVAGAIPKCTRYKNKWAAGIFDNLQRNVVGKKARDNPKCYCGFFEFTVLQRHLKE